jgi:hypothetical protein
MRSSQKRQVMGLGRIASDFLQHINMGTGRAPSRSVLRPRGNALVFAFGGDNEPEIAPGLCQSFLGLPYSYSWVWRVSIRRAR